MKRIHALLLAIAMLLAMLPSFNAIEVHAAASDRYCVETETATHINPLYADLITPEDLEFSETAAVAVSDFVYHSTMEAAAAELRKAMVARQETIVVGYQSNSYYSALHNEVFRAATAHTGVSNEGDALRWEYDGYKVGTSRSYRNGVYFITFTYTMKYKTTAQQEAQLKAAMNALLTKLNPTGSDYEKLSTVYTWICNNITYDYKHQGDRNYLLQYTPYAALIHRTAVCQGYTVLLYRFALEMGIDCRVIVGNNSNHGWNIVRLGSKYYNADPTWDAIWAQAGLPLTFYLQCEDTFTDGGTEHIRNEEYDTPEFHSLYPMTESDYFIYGDTHNHFYEATILAPTCTQGGYTTYTCACGDSYVTDYTNANGHVSVVNPPVDATCTTDGLSVGWYCVICNLVLVNQSVIPATGHSWNMGVVTLEPTEDAEGLRVYTCMTCGVTSEKSIAKLPHSHKHTAIVTAPTCTERGYTSYTCKCGNSYLAAFTTALGHTYQNGTCSTCGYIAIAAPVAKASNKESSGKPVITWDAVDGAVKYEIYRASSKNGTYSLKSATTKTSYTNTSAVAGKGYHYYVRAIAADGSYADSHSVSRTCDLAQTTVTLSNRSSDGKIVVSWESVEGATEYQVYRATSKDGTYSRISTTAKMQITNTNTKAGKTYYYKVRGICDVEAATAAYSTVKSRTCDLGQTTVTLSNKSSNGKIVISWESVEGATGYEVHRATSKDGTYSRIATTANTQLTNTSTEAGKAYYYKVRAICDVDAAKAAFSSAKYRTCDLPQPKASISTSSGKPKISWDMIPYAIGYNIYRSTSEAGPYSLIKTSTTNSYKDTKALSGNTYYYKVVAVCATLAGNSDFSKVVSITLN